MADPGRWQGITVGGKACEVFEPAAARPPDGAVVFLHGLAERTIAGHPAATAALDRHGLTAICPRTGRSWWTDRLVAAFDPDLSVERYLLDRVIPAIAERWGIRPPAVGLLGVSMGGQGALRLAFKYPRQFRSVAALSATIDYHELYGQGTPLDRIYPDRETARQDSAPLHVHPLNYPPHLFFASDPADLEWTPGNFRLHEKLLALGIAHQVDFQTTGGQHTWAYFDRLLPAAIDFLARGIEVERRRVGSGDA